MIFANECKVVGTGSAPELAIDVLCIITSILGDNDKEIINCMVALEMECDTDTLKNFAQQLIDTLEGISA